LEDAAAPAFGHFHVHGLWSGSAARARDRAGRHHLPVCRPALPARCSCRCLHPVFPRPLHRWVISRSR